MNIFAAPQGLSFSELNFTGKQKQKAKPAFRDKPASAGRIPSRYPARTLSSPAPVVPVPTPVASTSKFCVPSASDTFQYKVRTPNGVKKEETQIQSLIGGGQVFEKINETLDKAKSWVMLDMYDLQSPELYPERTSPVGTPGAPEQAKLVQKLVDLKNRNVNVRVILDNSKQMVRPPHTLEPDHNARAIEFLRKNGIETVTYPTNVSKINHTKMLMVDTNDNQYAAVVSGMNWGNHSATNHDGGVSIQGPDARNLFHKLFKPDWLTSGGDVSKLPPMKPFRPGKIQVLQTSGENSVQGAKNEILDNILSQIEQTKSSIHAELFVLTNKQVIEKLIEKNTELQAAGKEGVKILVDPGLYFQFPNCRPGIQKLARAGVPIRFLECNRSKEEKLHAKWAVFDRKNVLVGSANWSGLGLENKGIGWTPPWQDGDEAEEGEDKVVSSGAKGNHEMDVLLSDAPNVAGAFARQAAFDFRHHSFPILEKGDDLRWHPVKSAHKRPALRR